MWPMFSSTELVPGCIVTAGVRVMRGFSRGGLYDSSEGQNLALCSTERSLSYSDKGVPIELLKLDLCYERATSPCVRLL